MNPRHQAAAGPDLTVGRRVQTIDGIPGRILFADAAFSPGLTEYQVVLDNGMGQGTYTASQLRPIPDDVRPPAGAIPPGLLPSGVTAAMEPDAEAHVASADYPEMGDVLRERPDPGAVITVIGALRADAMGAAGPDYEGLTFTHQPREDLGPGRQWLHAVHPEHGPVGRLDYSRPGAVADIGVRYLEVPSGHQRRGVASQLMAELERRHPGERIDHGSRTDEGAGWAQHYYGDPAPHPSYWDDFIAHPARQTVAPRTASATQYGRPDDARDGDYNGPDGEMYWAEPAQQEWARDHYGPQEDAPPPPWMPPAMAMLAAVEEAGRLFGLRHHATSINGTQVDDHGDAPQHGTAPRAGEPNSYDDRSTEGYGDPRWSDPVDDRHKEDFNGALIGMYPEGISAGGGPGIEVGAFTAALGEPDDIADHLVRQHTFRGADLERAAGTRHWHENEEALRHVHDADHDSFGMHYHPHPSLTDFTDVRPSDPEARQAHSRWLRENYVNMHGHSVPHEELAGHLLGRHEYEPGYMPSGEPGAALGSALWEAHNNDHALTGSGSYRHEEDEGPVWMHAEHVDPYDAEHHLGNYHGHDAPSLRDRMHSPRELEQMHDRHHEEDWNDAFDRAEDSGEGLDHARTLTHFGEMPAHGPYPFDRDEAAPGLSGADLGPYGPSGHHDPHEFERVPEAYVHPRHDDPAYDTTPDTSGYGALFSAPGEHDPVEYDPVFGWRGKAALAALRRLAASGGAMDPVTARVPWTPAERGRLHTWQDVPTYTWGDFVPSGDFPANRPHGEPAGEGEEELRAEGAQEERWREPDPVEYHATRPERTGEFEDISERFSPHDWVDVADPSDHEQDTGGFVHHTLSALGSAPGEDDWAAHLQSGHGWSAENVARASGRGQDFEAMHSELHRMGMAGHRHPGPEEPRFGPPMPLETGRAHPGQGGTRLTDPADAIAHSAPVDWQAVHDRMPRRMLSSLHEAASEDEWREHMAASHGWTEESFQRAREHGNALGHLHEALHDAGMANHPPHADAPGAPLPSRRRDRRSTDYFGAPFSPGLPSDQGGGHNRADWLDSMLRSQPGPRLGDEEFRQRLNSRDEADDPGPVPGAHEHDDEGDSLESGEPWQWPLAGADVTEGGPAYTQGSGDGKRRRSATGAAHPEVRFHRTASWPDVVAKAKRMRSEGGVRITRVASGMVIGEVRGDHAVYESGFQAFPGKQAVMAWICGCPWASYHQNEPKGSTRYAGRMCSHAYAVRLEAQSRGMFGRTVHPDAPDPGRQVVVKSWPPYEGEPQAGRWREQWLAPSASLRRTGRLTPFDQLQPHERASVAQYHQQMIEEGNAQPGSTPRDYLYESRQEPRDDFLRRYMDADDEFKGEYGPGDWEAHHQDTVARHPIPSYPEANRWPLIVRDDNPNYVDDGYHRMHSYMQSGATHIPTIRMHRTATPDEARDWDWTPEERDEWEARTGSLSPSERLISRHLQVAHGLSPDSGPAYGQLLGDWHQRLHDARAAMAIPHRHDEDAGGTGGPRAQREDHGDDCYFDHEGPCPPGDDGGKTASRWLPWRKRPVGSFHVGVEEISPQDRAAMARANPVMSTPTHVVRATGEDGRQLGSLHFQQSNDARAVRISMLHTSPSARGQGVATGMANALISHAAGNGAFVNPGVRTRRGAQWWSSFEGKDAYPHLNVHAAHPATGWNRYFDPHEVRMDLADNHWRDRSNPAPPSRDDPHWAPSAPDARLWSRARAYDDDGLRQAVSFMVTADQANAPWGSENVTKHPPQQPYGATEAPNPDMSPASYGFLAAPDPDNWGAIDDSSPYQMPLTNTAALGCRHGFAWCGTCEHENWIAFGDIPGMRVATLDDMSGQERQEPFPYSDQSATGGQFSGLTPSDPGGIRMEEALSWPVASGTPVPSDSRIPELGGALAELRDDPEPALPSTTGDDIEATAAADGTIGGGDAGDGREPQAPADVAALGEFGATRSHPDPSGVIRRQFRTMFGGTAMGDLGRETFPQAQAPSQAGQEPGMGSMDEELSPDNPSIQTIGQQQWSGAGTDSDEVDVPAGQPHGSLDDIVAAFQRSAAARQFSGGAGRAADGDIAGAARAYLSKTADVLPDAEAAALIAEGRGERARNLGLLRLEGTHYEDEDSEMERRGLSLDDFDDDVVMV